jgi:hypothetical protein
VCVWDIYRSDLKDYNRQLLDSDPAATPVAEVEQAAMVEASLDAFERLERQLQRQKAERESEQQQQQQQQQEKEKD